MRGNDDHMPWALWQGPVSDGEINTYCTLRQAVLHKEQVVALHKGLFIVLCPLAVGIRGGRRVVLAHLIVGEEYEGDPETTLPPHWCCLPVTELHVVSTSRGLWPLNTDAVLLVPGFHVDVQTD
jgi:hypothetical protein